MPKISGVRIEIDEGYLDYIPKAVNDNGVLFLASIIKTVGNYVPQDTETMKNTHNVLRDDTDYSLTLYYGSVHDDRYNEIVIAQHEKELRHFGSPGGSMRDGITSDIPGVMYVRNEYFAGKTLQQKAEYQIGYRQKADDGQLTQYKSEFLKKAVDDVVTKSLKKSYGKDISIPKSASRKKVIKK